MTASHRKAATMADDRVEFANRITVELTEVMLEEFDLDEDNDDDCARMERWGSRADNIIADALDAWNTRTLDPSIESLQAHCAEAEMRAHQWMKAHDKLKAGKPYDLPKPADLPEAIESLQAEVERLRTLVRNYVDPFDVTPADHAMVLALGTDDEEGYRQALAAKEQTR